MRWLSPPESVPELRDRVRYSRPTLTRKPSRSLISFRMRPAISICLALSRSGRPANQSRAPAIDICAASPACISATRTASASGLRRKPLHAEQGATVWYLLSSSRTQLESVSRQRRARLVITPSNGRLVSYLRRPSS